VLCGSVEETENDDKAIIGISYGRNVSFVVPLKLRNFHLGEKIYLVRVHTNFNSGAIRCPPHNLVVGNHMIKL